MKINSTKELSVKVWYRLLKVIWGLFWLFIIGSILAINIFSYRSAFSYSFSDCKEDLETGDTYDIPAFLRMADYFERTDKLRFNKLLHYLGDDTSSTIKDFSLSSKYEELKNLKEKEFDYKNPTINSISTLCNKSASYSTSSPAQSILIGLFISLLLFEAIRRVFYYIAIGSLDPNHDYKRLFMKLKNIFISKK
jgi:hypothetical protein